MFPIIVSYFTKNTGYEKEAKNLMESCELFNLPYECEGIDSLGSWEKNCCFKPRFLLEKFKKLKKPLLWLDADSVIIKKPTLFESFPYDIALYTVKNVPDTHPSKMISGTVFINYTPQAEEVLYLWEKECQRMLKEEKTQEVWDQIALRNVLLKKREETKVYDLPQEYYMIYDKDLSLEKKEKTIIMHYQASRILKKVVNNEVVPFWNEEISSEEMKKTRDLFST